MLFRNSIKKIILIIILILILCVNENLANTEGEVSLESDKDIIKLNEEIEISVNSNFKTAAYNIYIYFDNNKFEYISGPENVNIKGNEIIYVWYDNKGGEGEKEKSLEKFKFKAKEEGIATFNIYGEFYTKKAQKVKTNFKEKQIKIGKENKNINTNNILKVEETEDLENKNTNLETLAFEGYLLYPAFDNNITNYKIEIGNNIDEVKMLAIPEDESANVEIIKNDILKEGNNEIKVLVTARDGITKKEFTINAYKRNKEEEIKYQEEQKENEEKLNKIYETEKVDIKNVQNDEIDIKNKKSIIYFIIILSLVLIISIIIARVKRKNKEKIKKK